MTVPPAEPGASSSAEQVVAGLAKLSLVMRHEAWKASGRRGLTPTQSQILAVIAGSREPVGIKAVAEQLAVTAGTVSEAVTTLTDKGLVEKRTDPSDGRALVLVLTRAGRREAAKAAQWPEALRRAVEELPMAEQGGLLRGLAGMVRWLQAQGAVPTARMCVECRYFRPNAYPGSERAHHCQFIDAPIGDADLRLDCDDMETAPPQVRTRLWALLVEGRPLDEALAADYATSDPRSSIGTRGPKENRHD